MRHLLLLILLIVSLTSYSQQDTVYFNSEGKVIIKEFASFYRVCQYDTTSGYPIGDFIDYQVNTGKIISSGTYSEKGKNGTFKLFNLDESIRQELSFKNDKPFGIWYYYFTTGDTAYTLTFEDNALHVIQCKDTLLNDLIIEGDGTFQNVLSDVLIEGKVKDKLMSGTWSMGIPGGEIKEKFSKGSFKSSNVDVHPYFTPSSRILEYIIEYRHFTVLEELEVSSLYRKKDYPRLHNMFAPRWEVHDQESEGFIIVEDRGGFPGGVEYLSTYIYSRLSYPKEAEANSIVGEVVVEFTVDVDGQVIDPVIIQSLGYGCDEVVLDIVQYMPDWIPGQQRGKRVPMKFKLPIKFGE